MNTKLKFFIALAIIGSYFIYRTDSWGYIFSIVPYLLAFAVLLGVLVTIHEFGHFIFARMFKVHVQRFSIGMGPVFYKKYDKHGTEFALSAVPLGGYVSMITNKLIEHEPEVCEQLTEDQIKNTFDSKPKWQRALIMFAGPLANFLLSIFLLTFIFFNTPDPQLSPIVMKVNNQASANASISSFEVGDKILSINEVEVRDPKDVSLELISYAGYSGNMDFLVQRSSSEDPILISLSVDDFLNTNESQANPLASLTKYFGIEIVFRGEPVIAEAISNGFETKELFLANDRVLQIGGEKITYADEIQSAIFNNPSSDLEFTIERNNEILYVPVAISSKNIGVLGTFFESSNEPILGEVIEGSAAFNANLKRNDRIIKIGDKEIKSSADILSVVLENPDKDLEFILERDKEILYVPVTIGSKVIGNVDNLSYGAPRGFLQSLSKGVFETYNLSVKTIQFIGKMITGNMGTQNLSGPIGIAQMAGDQAQAGFLPFISLMALLSISLAVLNLLPIPVLDGGQLTLLGVEAIRGKPLPEKAENMIYTGGAVLVGMLMIFAIFNDVSRFF